MSSPPVAFSCPLQWGLQLSSMQVLSFSAGMAIQLDEGPLLVFFSRPYHLGEFYVHWGCTTCNITTTGMGDQSVSLGLEL